MTTTSIAAAGSAAMVPSSQKQENSVSKADYEYMLTQSNYWKIKAEDYRNDVQRLKSERKKAWQDITQLENTLKEKQLMIQKLERVIDNFNLQ